jgi:hypothetical protein
LRRERPADKQPYSPIVSSLICKLRGPQLEGSEEKPPTPDCNRNEEAKKLLNASSAIERIDDKT